MANLLFFKKIELPRGFFSFLLALSLTMTGFALIQSVLVSFCIETLNFSDHLAYMTNTCFIVLIFSLPVLGGYIANKLTGYGLTSIFCLLLVILGLYLLCFQTKLHFYIGFSLFCVGNSIAVACLYIILGRLLIKFPKIRTAAYTLAYTAMNCGALIAILASSFAIRTWGYQSTFLISAIVFILALFFLLLTSRHYFHLSEYYRKKFTVTQRGAGLSLIVALVPCVIFLLKRPQYIHYVLTTFVLIAALFMSHIFKNADAEMRPKVKQFIILTLFGVFFWALYALEPTVLRHFVERNVNRSIAGISIPASEFFSLNPFFIIVLGICFSFMWYSLNQHNRGPSLPYKFAIGIGLIGGAFLILSASTYFANKLGLIGMEWVIVTYLLLSAAELCISPIGLAMVGLLAPNKYEGPMMGIWLLSNGIGSSISVYLASLMVIQPSQALKPLNTNALYGYRFCEFGLIALAIAVILSLLSTRIITQSSSSSSSSS